MKWLKRKGEAAPNSYWDTISDVMSTLLLVLMLVMVLLILYVVRAPDYKLEESIPESEIISEGTEEQYIEREAGHAVLKTDVPYLFAAPEDEEYGRGELTGDYLYEEGGFGEGEFDGHEGAAVRVIVEDAETHQPIREAGVTFSLYTAEGRRRALYTYYPAKTPWLTFETDESGSFFLPQKLPLTDYILHGFNAPAGYGMPEDLYFAPEEAHPWSDPIVLHVELPAAKNTIALTALDRETGEPVEGATFEILAAEDVTTLDGTLRYAEGTVADTIVTDAEGRARSAALFLGNYSVRQNAAPEHYAAGKESYAVALGEGMEDEAGEAEELKILCDKTRFTLTAVDELYRGMGIPEAEFELRSEKAAEPTLRKTDDAGHILLEDLDKETEYTLSQRSTAEGYRVHEGEIRFTVDSLGRIDGEALAEEQVTNRTLRLAVLVKDAVFRNAVTGCRVSLYDAENRLVKAWYSTELETVIEGLSPGEHRLEITGAGKTTETLSLEDTAAVQSFSTAIWTTGNLLMLGGTGAGLAAVGTGGTLLIRRGKKRGRRRK